MVCVPLLVLMVPSAVGCQVVLVKLLLGLCVCVCVYIIVLYVAVLDSTSVVHITSLSMKHDLDSAVTAPAAVTTSCEGCENMAPD